MTANMNFGPKWMRGGEDSMNNFKSPLEESNEFKYSKEFMLSLYQPYQIPEHFERHEHITAQESLRPKSFEPPSETEKKLLAGPVHSQSSRRNIINAVEKNQNQVRNDLSGSPMNSPTSENAPMTPGRMARKGRSGDYFPKDQTFKRVDSDHLRRRDPNDSTLPSLRADENDSFSGWQKSTTATTPAAAAASLASPTVATGNGSGGFNGLFRSSTDDSGKLFNRPAVFGGDIGGASKFGGSSGSGSSFMSSLTGATSAVTAAVAKRPEEFKWFYRDPSGQVQGPFEATEMQDWFVAGFFSNSLMVRRDDEPMFEQLAKLIKKVGSEREPFMTPFPNSSPVTAVNEFSRSSDLFGSPGIESPSANHLFRSTTSTGGSASILGDNAKYMPFSGGGVSNGGNSTPTTPLFQSPYGGFGGGGSSLLRDGNNPWSDSSQQQQQTPQQQKPSWLNPTSGSVSDLFGSATTPLGINPLGGSSSSMSPMFGGAGVGGVGGMGAGMSSPGLFDYQRLANDQMDQHQQYLQMLQQKQQQQNMQFQQHLQAIQQQQQQQYQQQLQQQQQQLQQQQQQKQLQQQQQFQQQQQQQQQQPQHQMQQQQLQQQTGDIEQEPSFLNNSNNNNPISQNPLKNLTLDLGSNHASPVLRSNVLSTGGWGSIPGTPVGNDSPSSPWGSIVSTAIPTKISEELQAKAPGAQSPRAPSSPKKPIERTINKSAKPIEEALVNLQLEEEQSNNNNIAVTEKTSQKKSNTPSTVEKAKSAKATTSTSPVAPQATAAAPAPAKPAAVNKPIISLREIQEEEMRKAEEKKQKQAKAAAAAAAAVATSWGPTPGSSPSIVNSGSWSQPVASQKPLSLREIQEMEAKEAASKRENSSPSAAEYLAASQNNVPTNLSWGVVVPNSSTSSNKGSPAAASATTAAAPWVAPSAPKKTLREIQLEEEAAMKKKNTKAAAKAASAVYANAAASAASAPKTYSVPSSVANDGSWTTVTSSRAPKVASPATTPAPAAPVRYEPVQQKPIQRTPTRPAADRGPSEEFRRWCKQSLRGLNSGVNGEEILSMLLSFPLDAGSAEIIEDVIYANSESMNGKRFAEEFMKLRRADMTGKLDAAIATMEEEDDFKVVTKKGKKKNAL